MELQLWKTYNREEIHGIFSPTTTFTPQTGTWGLQGIVKIPDRPGDYVFLVTFGTEQNNHLFDESITQDGVLTWQSQPKQSFSSPVIQELIAHDERTNGIHLFLRTNRNPETKYSYLGTLGYLTHDLERQEPAYFQWQLLDWPAADSVIQDLGLDLFDSTNTQEEIADNYPNRLIKIDKPVARGGRKGKNTKNFTNVKQSPRLPDLDARNAELGLAGELLVLDFEREMLMNAGRPDLAKVVTHVSVIEGDSAGYDIRSFLPTGATKYIEVKTTRGSKTTAFFASQNQVEFSEKHSESFYLYRVCDFDAANNSGKVYESKGPLIDGFELSPTEFKVTLKSADEDEFGAIPS